MPLFFYENGYVGVMLGSIIILCYNGKLISITKNLNQLLKPNVIKILKPIWKGINMFVESHQKFQNKHVLINSCNLLQHFNFFYYQTNPKENATSPLRYVQVSQDLVMRFAKACSRR
jgi:hypothetical protein